MTTNMKWIWLNRALNAVMWLAGAVAGMSAAGQVPKSLEPYAAILAIVGGIAAKFAKTPSQSIAAAVPPIQFDPKAPAGGGVPEPLPSWREKDTPPPGTPVGR